jgi:hypothetical protein
MCREVDEFDFEAIAEHIAMCIKGAERGREVAQKVAKLHPSDYSANQLRYWKNVIQGLRWALALAKQRLRKTVNGRGTSVQFPGPDIGGGG